jgi:hypothetical protein
VPEKTTHKVNQTPGNIRKVIYVNSDGFAICIILKMCLQLLEVC